MTSIICVELDPGAHMRCIQLLFYTECDNLIDDFLLDDEGKLGHGFTSADVLEEVDIGKGWHLLVLTWTPSLRRS